MPNTSKIDTNKDKIKSISYAQFLTSINLNNTGILKTSLSNAIKTDKGALMNNDAGSNGFIIDTDSIKKLTLGDTVSYVIRLKQETPRAIQFRNLTIQVVNNNTTAFVTTYVPDKEWRNELKNGHQIAFKGTHFSQSIELSNLKSLTFSSVPDVDVTYKPQKLQSTNYQAGKKTSTVRYCETYYVYEYIPFKCSWGHWPWDCDPNTLPSSLESNEWESGYYLVVNMAQECYNIESPGGGEGGGGSTTPNPPGGYDPCNTETPTVAYAKINNGLKLAVLPPSPCDGGGGSGGGLPPLIDPHSDSEVSYGIFDLEFDNPNETTNNQSIIISSDYNFNGISNSFSQDEFDNIINNLSNDLNDDPIQFYLLATYKHNKVLNSSTYSVSMNAIKVGDFYLTPHYNNQNILVFYSASRNSNVGIEYIIKANALTKFKDSYTLYKTAADLFYQNGKPELWQIQISAGDYWEGILNSWKSHLSDPGYVLSLAHLYVGSTTNIKTTPVSPTRPAPTPKIKYTIITEPNSRYPSIRIENMSIAEYKIAISTKYSKPWITEPNNSLKSRLQVDNKMYFEHPSSTSPYPTIDVSRNGKLIGKFRFNN